MPGSTKTEKNTGVSIQRATRADAKAIVELVVGLAEFERLEPPNADARARLPRDIFDRKLAGVFVARVGKRVVGYALYFYTYSSFLARPTLYLEDIFVLQENRRGGVGNALFMKCVREANRRGCGRMEWSVLTWNRKAMRFYERLGARRIEDQRLYRLSRGSLQGLSDVPPAKMEETRKRGS